MPEKDIKACMFPFVSYSSAQDSFPTILGTSRSGFRSLSIPLFMTMHTILCVATLVGAVYSAPQLINLDAIAQDFPPPDLVKAPINVESNIAPAASTEAIIPLESVSARKRDLEKRDGDCSPYPAGPGPVPSPDTPAAFQSDPDFAACLHKSIATVEQHI